MKVNKNQLQLLEEKIEEIKKCSFAYIHKYGSQTQIVQINTLAYECGKIIKEKLKQE